MTVDELIEALYCIDDQNTEVLFYNEYDNMVHKIFSVGKGQDAWQGYLVLRNHE